MRLIWVRHGQTADNAKKKYIGHTDSPLNEKGWQQARALGEKLKKRKIDRIYSSDLCRCQDTADEIARGRGLTPLLLSELRELHFGQWEEKTYEEIMALDRKKAMAWFEQPFTHSPPGGETLYGLGKRVDDRLRDILRQTEEEETLLIVSHGGPIRWFQCTWVMKDPFQYWVQRPIGHGEVSSFLFINGQWIQEEDPLIE